MDLEPDNAHTRKKSRGGWASAVVMPEFGGLRVIEVDKAPLFKPGELIAWADVSSKSYQGSVTTFVSRGDRDSHPVAVKGGNRGSKLAARLKQRATLMNESDPVFVYAPERESVRNFWIGSVCFGALVVSGLVFFSIRTLQIVSGSGWILGVVGFLGGTMPAWLGCLVVWSIHAARPRNPQYDRVAVSRLGFRLERDESDPIECEWQEVTGYKRFGHDPTRLRLDLVYGVRLWITIPKRVRADVRSRIPVALGGIDFTQKVSLKPIVWQGIRFLILGVVCAAGAAGLLLWLRNAGLLLQPHFRKFLGPTVAMCLLPLWYIGLVFLWIAWRNTPKGRRAIRRWSRRVGQRIGRTRSRRPSPG